MADPYWMYSSDPRVQAASAAAAVAAAADPRLHHGAVAAGAPPPTAPAKRPRSDYAVYGYYSRENERMASHAARSTEGIGLNYDRYMRNGQLPSYGSGGVAGHPVNAGYHGGRAQPPLSADATNTLYVECLPASCSRREVSHIFRPFVGFQEVRLVNKESKLPGGDPLVLCFVDFASPSHAAVALESLQGYVFDLDDAESASLRLQFARFPGPRSGGGGGGGGPRGRR